MMRCAAASAMPGKSDILLQRVMLSPREARLLLQRQNPAHQVLDVGVRYLRIGWHRNLAPNANSAFLDLVGELGDRVLVVLVLCGDVLVRRSYVLLVHG